MTERKRSRALYGAPLIHLALYLAMMSGYVVPRLQFLGLLGTVLTLIDLPFVTIGTFMLWRYPLLANIWIVVAGTLWWYFLSWLFFKAKSTFVS